MKLVDDDTILRDMAFQPDSAELRLVSNLITVWADAMEKLPPENQHVRITFLACLQLIKTMGPAYCQIAEVNFNRWKDNA